MFVFSIGRGGSEWIIALCCYSCFCIVCNVDYYVCFDFRFLNQKQLIVLYVVFNLRVFRDGSELIMGVCCYFRFFVRYFIMFVGSC